MKRFESVTKSSLVLPPGSGTGRQGLRKCSTASCATMRWTLAKSKLCFSPAALKSLIQLEDQPQTQARQSSQSAKYVLQHGIEVLVIQGDMTKQYADALVNPANENLEHGGGLAAALSAAGGPQVQIESRNTVAQGGKIPVGSAVMTTSGSLKCKKLIHVVGPINGQVGGRERPLLEKGVQSALDLAETMNFKSIAIPCISSGLFGMPLRVCSEAIVTAVKTFGSQAGRSLTRIILIDSKADVVLALLDACDRLLKEGAAKSYEIAIK
uniref:Macro domain-containing protein n=1 Tax=Salarias fasciatus TaxID=181472 RepID=A0A672IFQ2_SALFA